MHCLKLKAVGALVRLACVAAAANGIATVGMAGAGADAGASAWLAMLAGRTSAEALLPARALAALWAATGSRAGAAAPGELGLTALTLMALPPVACG